jgi:hypothetical protein
MMSVSFGTFLIIGLYLDNVLPSAFGRRKPFYFCLSPSFWRGAARRRVKIVNKSSSSFETEANDPNKFELKYLKPENYEAPPRELLKQESE